MVNMRNQPFLMSLQREAGQTGDFEDFKTLLLEQQNAFKEFLYDHCHSKISVELRYEFLKTADYEICSIRLMCADKIRENDAVFFRFWSNLTMDTRRYINIGVKTLEFLTTCPVHMLKEPSKTFPDFEWTANKIDLSEVLVGIYQIDVIRSIDGSRPSFEHFVQYFGNVFGISYDYLYTDARRVINRKKSQTPFLLRVIAAIKSKRIKMDGLRK